MTFTEKYLYRKSDWWRSKISFIAGFVCLIVFLANIPFAKSLSLIGLILLSSIGFSVTGYLINDYFDRTSDARAGKQNLFQRLSVFQLSLIFPLAIILAISPWFFLPTNKVTIGLLSFEGLLFILYSAPFVRLKERGVLGLISDSLYAHVVPCALLATTIFLAASITPDILLILLIVVWQFFVGLRNIILHQLKDLDADKVSGVISWVIKKGIDDAKRAVRVLQILDLASFLALIIYIVGIHRTVITIPLMLLLYSLSVYVLWRKKGYGEPRYFPNYLYEKVLPLSVLLLLCFSDFRYLGLLAIHIALFNMPEVLSLADKIRFFVVMSYYGAKVKVVVPLWLKIKLNGNYLIYYFFKIAGVDLIKEKTSALGFFKRKLSQTAKD